MPQISKTLIFLRIFSLKANMQNVEESGTLKKPAAKAAGVYLTMWSFPYTLAVWRYFAFVIILPLPGQLPNLNNTVSGCLIENKSSVKHQFQSIFDFFFAGLNRFEIIHSKNILIAFCDCFDYGVNQFPVSFHIFLPPVFSI